MIKTAAAVMKDEQGRPFIVVREYVQFRTAFDSRNREWLDRADGPTAKGRRRDNMEMRPSNPIYLLQERSRI